MSLSWEEIQGKALQFAKKWGEREGKERQQAQMFVKDFLSCFGISDPLKLGEFERPCKKEFSKDGYIDYFSPKSIIIEMKSKGKNLNDARKQVEGYILHLPSDEMPPLIMVSDFEYIVIKHRETGKQKKFLIKNLHRNIRDFAIIAGYETSRIYDDGIEVNIKAAEKMAKLHDAIKQYGYAGHQLEVYLVRLLFCMFAEDTGIFPKTHFINYIENSKKDGSDLSMRISKLFEVLNTPEDKRNKLLSADLLQFRYINGKLFEEKLNTPEFDTKMRQTIIDCCSFDWSKISPAIFGSMFQGIMDTKQRRELGAHYTSEENILKLINPLFLDKLWSDFEKIKTNPKELDKFHNELANLKFLDPACGCGNFLIITYRELRKLEIEVLKMKISTAQHFLDFRSLLKVRVTNFYGIEYEEFPCQIAQVGMWLIDHQMNLRVAETFGEYYVRLPLTESATIKHANALTIDWEEVVSKNELSYILGNPPFVGGSIMSKTQKDELVHIFNYAKNAGNLDYVCCWYKKATVYIQHTNIQVAFVSTNSICQGEQVVYLWKSLFENGIHIKFAYKTFKWNNEAKGKAAVYCVIIGFSIQNNKTKLLFEEGKSKNVNNINGYLCDAPNIFVEKHTKPFFDIPQMRIGNKPVDNGHYLFSEQEKNAFIVKEPSSEPYFKRWIGSAEFINNIPRYFLYLTDCPPNKLKKMPECIQRIEAVKDFRLKSKKQATQRAAQYPLDFGEKNCPPELMTGHCILIPSVSSERREYVPIGFVKSNVIVGNSAFVISQSTLFHFAVLTSAIHNHWMRAVAGRLEMRYRYSKDIVYNNFPWPNTTAKQKSQIGKLAQAVLDSRNLFPESSLADLYNPLLMPIELRKAHQNLDTAVMKLYGFSKRMSEGDIVAELLKQYQNLVYKHEMLT